MSAQNRDLGLEKTSGHVFAETDELLQDAIDRASEAKSAGNGRSRGYASLIVLVAGLLFQSGGIFALTKLSPPETLPVNSSSTTVARFTGAEVNLIDSNLQRILSNTKSISSVKQRIAPAMPIDANIAAIEASVQDLGTVLLPNDESAGVGGGEY